MKNASMPLGNTLAESLAMIMFTDTLDIQQNISKIYIEQNL